MHTPGILKFGERATSKLAVMSAPRLLLFLRTSWRGIEQDFKPEEAAAGVVKSSRSILFFFPDSGAEASPEEEDPGMISPSFFCSTVPGGLSSAMTELESESVRVEKYGFRSLIVMAM